jgi:hypothetical protein
LVVTAWQNPTDSCPECAQDIQLRPEITRDIRLIYVRYCPRCDGGEPIGRFLDRPVPMRLDAGEIWGGTPRGQRPPDLVVGPSPAPVAGSTNGPLPVAAERYDVDLWWDGDGDGSGKHRTSRDARWAQFAAGGSGEVGDEPPGAEEGSFSFNVDDAAPKRRKSRLPHRLRQSA